MSTTEDARELYRRFLLELWHADVHDLESVAAELVTPDFVIRRRGGEEETRGPAAAAELVRASAELFDDHTVSLDVGPIVEGDLVCGRWTFTGRYRGGMPGMAAPPGRVVSFSGHDIVRIRDGRIAVYWVAADGDHLMEQLATDK